MKEERPDEVPHLSKIKALFDYREIPEYIAFGGIDPHFIEYLYRIQSSIYDLDDYLEKVWVLENKRIQHYWELMKVELGKLLRKESNVDQYLYQISVYLKREQGLRKRVFSLKTSLKYFYYYKSCDVRLMRRLIHDHCNVNKAKLAPTNWFLYDLVTEVNDDIDDVFEDMDIFNCNRFLFSCLEYGVEETAAEFKVFLSQIASNNKSAKTDERIKQATATAIQDTLILLDDRIGKLSTLQSSDLVVFQKLCR